MPTARTRRIILAVAGVVLGVGIAAGVATFGGGRSGGARSDAPVTSDTNTDPDADPGETATTDRWTTEGGDPSAPTAAARSGSEAILAMPVDGDDCGSTPADAGWPTTMLPAPLDSGSCLLAARATGRAAHQDFTGRTGDGGALVTRYVLDTDGTVTVHRWTVDADGSASGTETSCSPPDGTWAINIEGPIVVFGAEATYC